MGFKEELRQKYAPVIASITSSLERDKYLQDCDDKYTRFILKKLQENERNEVTSIDQLYEIHHIIPRCCGGPEYSWNKIRLLFSDHREAHAIRFQTYGEECDRLALLLGRNVTVQYRKDQLEESLRVRRERKVGIHDPAVQSASGKKGGAVWTQNKRDGVESKLSPVFVAARAAGMKWTHISGVTCYIKPGDIQLPMDLVERLAAKVPFSEGTNLKSVPGSLLKVIKKTRIKHANWSVEIGDNVQDQPLR